MRTSGQWLHGQPADIHLAAAGHLRLPSASSPRGHHVPPFRVYHLCQQGQHAGLEIKDEPTHFGHPPGEWYATQETCSKAHLCSHPISQPTAGMFSLHPEKVDPFISLAMLRDYLALTDTH